MKTWIIALALVVLVAGCTDQQQNTQPTDQNRQLTDQPQQTAPNQEIVEITSSGYNPQTVTIKSGDSVQWINKGTTPNWVASDVHPTHALYPEPGGCIGSKFDACRPLSQGDTFVFTFTHKGTWGYHDHLNPSIKGTVVVN